MRRNILRAMQTESEMPTGENAVDKGKLKISVTSEITAYPVEDALISISYTGVPENTLEEVRTDRSGMTESVELSTPPLEYSLDPENVIQPYSEYTLNISAPGFEPVSIAGTELLPEVTALQNIRLRPVVPETQEQVFVIPAHTLYGDYPPEDTLTIYGSLNQSVEDKIDYTENIVEIEGGNHAQFGSYGLQRGDPPAEITPQEQQARTVEAISDFLAQRQER